MKIWILVSYFMGMTGLVVFTNGNHPARIADDVVLKGRLGSDTKIEVHLEVEQNQPFFALQSAQCIALTGTYYHHTNLRRMPIRGELCPATGTFYLQVMEDDLETERFDGEWSPHLKQLHGTWQGIHGERKKAFELFAVERDLDETTMSAYYLYLQRHLYRKPDLDEAAASDARWRGGQGELINFRSPSPVQILHFSPTRFVYSIRQQTDSTLVETTCHYQLLHSETLPTVFYCSTTVQYRKEPGDSVHPPELFFAHSNGHFAVYQVAKGKIQDITATVLPENTSAEFEPDCTHEGEPCPVEVLSDAVSLPNGNHMWWYGENFSHSRNGY